VGNSWRFAENKYFPMPLGVHLKIKVHPALENIPEENEKLLQIIEKTIGIGVEALQHQN
jgi:hypothetical protein